MNFKKVIKGSLAMALVFGTATIAGCGNNNDKVDKNSKQYQIYQLAVDAGATDLSYEDWIISIKGSKGDASKVTIGSNGNWFIDGVDTKVSAIPTSGKDGTTWLTGVEAPSNNQGKEGDFYFNSNTKDIYCKQDGVWAKKTTLNDGKDGTTWHSGSGAPSNNVIAKVGDFYFDNINNDIYFYTSEGWKLEVDLEEKEEVKDLVLKPGVYTGYLDGAFFEITFANVGANLHITSLIVNNVEYANTANIKYNIENNIVSLEVSITDTNKITSKMILKDNNRFVIYVDEEEKGLIKGVYEDWYSTSAKVLTLSDNTFALSYDYTNFKGTWEIIGVNENSYDILLKSEDRVFFANIDYYYRYVQIYKLGDFKSITYDYNGTDFVYSQIKTSVGTIEETIKIGNSNPIPVVDTINFESSESHLLLVEIEDESYVLDYINGVVYDTKEHNIKFAGKVSSFDKDGEFVYFEKRDEIVLIEGDFQVIYNDYLITYDMYNDYVSVYVNGEQYFWTSLNDAEYIDNDTIVCVNGSVKATFTFNADNSIKSMELGEVSNGGQEENGSSYYLGEFGAIIEVDENGQGTIEWDEAGSHQEYGVECEVIDNYLFIKVHVNETKYITNYYRIGEKNGEGYVLLHNDLDKVSGVSKGLFTYNNYDGEDLIHSFTLDIYSYESNNYFAQLTETNYDVSGDPEVETRIVKVEIDNDTSTLTFGDGYTYVFNSNDKTLTIQGVNNFISYQIKNGGNFKTLSLSDDQNFVLVGEQNSSSGTSTFEITGTYEFDVNGYIVLTQVRGSQYTKYYFSVNYNEYNEIVSIGGAPHGYNVRTFDIVASNDEVIGSLAIYDVQLNDNLSNGVYYALLNGYHGPLLIRVNVNFTEQIIDILDDSTSYVINSNGSLSAR